MRFLRRRGRAAKVHGETNGQPPRLWVAVPTPTPVGEVPAAARAGLMKPQRSADTPARHGPTLRPPAMWVDGQKKARKRRAWLLGAASIVVLGGVALAAAGDATDLASAATVRIDDAAAGH